MIELISNYGIFILIILFIIVSLYFKNFVNIAIFVILFLGLRIIVDSKQALLYAYVLAILYGIAKNFHLLENFTSKKTPSDQDQSVMKLIERQLFKANDTDGSDNNADDNGKLKKPNNGNNNGNGNDNGKLKKTNNNGNGKLKNTSNGNGKTKKVDKQVAHSVANISEKDTVPDIDELISEELINKFIRRLKHEDNLLIKKQKINLYKINPTVNKLSKNKVDKIKTKLLNDDEFVNKPIVITNDYFILDGHHRWFAKKSLVENNSNGYNTTGVYDENIRVVIIDYNVRKCVQKLQEYKIKYNTKYLQKTINEINNISKGKKYLDEIKDVINNMESNYKNFASVELI